MGSLAVLDQEIIVRSVYSDLQLPEKLISIPSMLQPIMEKFSKNIALVCGVTKEEYTYKQVLEYSENFASHLRKLNIENGTIVGMVSPMSSKAIIAMLSVWKADCIIAPFNPITTKGELNRKFEALNIENIITTQELLPLVQSSGHFKNIFVTDLVHDNTHGTFGIEELMTTFCNEIPEIKQTIDKKNKKHIAVVSSSTGTTGDPKSVAITHFALCANTRFYCSQDVSNTKMLGVGGRKRNVTITCFPIAHAMGYMISFIWPMYQGFKIVCLPKFEPKLYHDCFRTYKPTHCALVTYLVKFLIDSPLFEARDFEHLDTIFAAGTPLPKMYIEDLVNKAKRNIIFQEAFGTTETLLVSICNPSLNNTKFGSVGRLFPNITAKIADLITGKSVGPNMIGEIRIKTPCQMKCYYNDETTTKAAYDENGFYLTGDVGYYDEDECFYIVDRVRDMIKVKGLQVAPKEIELEIVNHPKVDNVCVIGVPHERFGEAPRAYIVSKDENLTAEEIHDFIEDKIATFKHLAGGIEFIDAIPQVGVGKPLRRELRDRYLAGYRTKTVN